MKDGLDSKSGISKFLHAREYRRAARDAYRYAKVAFAFDLLYRMSYYCHRSMYQTEAEMVPFSLSHRIHWCLLMVGFTFAFPVYSNLTPRGLEDNSEDNSDHVIRVARHLYSCYLSCNDAFPSPYLKDEWIAVVWSDAYARIGGCANSSPLAEEASPVSRQMLHSFT